MNRDLYFVSILAEALGQPDRWASLRQAFWTIEKLGKQVGFEQGYVNFCRFMAEVFAASQLLDEDAARRVVLRSASSMPGDSDAVEDLLWELMEGRRDLREEYAFLCQLCKRREGMLLQLLRDDRQIAEISFEGSGCRRVVDGISPGRYAIRLDVGLMLWEGAFSCADVVWTEAFEGENLALAAEAGEVRRRMSRQIDIVDAHLILRVFPGIEQGSLEIELTS